MSFWVLGEKQKHQRYFTSVNPDPVKVQLSASQSSLNFGPVCPMLQEMLLWVRQLWPLSQAWLCHYGLSPLGKGLFTTLVSLVLREHHGTGSRGGRLQMRSGWHELPLGLSDACRHRSKIKIKGVACLLVHLAARFRMGPWRRPKLWACSNIPGIIVLLLDKMNLCFVMTDNLFVDHLLFLKNIFYVKLKCSPKKKEFESSRKLSEHVK